MSKQKLMVGNDTQKILKKLEDHEKRIRTFEISGWIKQKRVIKEKGSFDDPNNLILSIVNKIEECEKSQAIQNKVLDQKSTEGRILLCFYISYKYFENAWLTTGNIEKITSDLGIKIDVRNVTNKIKELRQYLESGVARKKGQPTPYRLNRKGVKRFEEILYRSKS